MIEYEAPIANYYGRPTLRFADDRWILEIDDYDGADAVTVSTDFAEAWIKEFGSAED